MMISIDCSDNYIIGKSGSKNSVETTIELLKAQKCMMLKDTKFLALEDIGTLELPKIFQESKKFTKGRYQLHLKKHQIR